MLRHADRLPIPARAALVGAYLLLLALLAASLPTIHVLVQATAFTSDAVFRLPVRPLTWFTGDPSTEEISWRDGGRGLLTLPAGDTAEPALILVLGADPAPADDERVERLTDSLARIGFAVLLTRSAELDDATVLPLEIPRLVGAFETLAAHPRVRPDRIGYVGLSAGGSLAIVAASQPEIAAEVRFVVAIGPYYDAASLAAAILSHSYRGPDGIKPWEPDRVSQRTVRRTLLALLPESERDAVETGGMPTTAAGLAVAALLDQPSLPDAEALIGLLGEEQRAILEAVSPAYQIAGLRAPLYLIHDRNDEFIPWVESEALARAHKPAVYHRTKLFEHVDPHPANLGSIFRDGRRLLRLFVRIIEDSR